MKMENMETAEQMYESGLPDDLMRMMTQEELRVKILKMEKDAMAMEADPEADKVELEKLKLQIKIARGMLQQNPKGAQRIPGIEYR